MLDLMVNLAFAAALPLCAAGFACSVQARVEEERARRAARRPGRRCGLCGRTTHRTNTPGTVVDVHRPRGEAPAE